MSDYTQSVMRIRTQYERKLRLEKEIETLSQELEADNEEFCAMLEALEYIGCVSDANAERVLDFITGTINSTLAKIFPYNKRAIKLDKSLYRNAYSHINVKLLVGDEMKERSLVLSGTGLRQIISNLFLFTIVEVRKERGLILIDECFSGLHSRAKKIMGDIISIFASGGCQFIITEYSMNDIGKIYLAEKKGDTSVISEFQGEYTDDIIFTDEEDEEVIAQGV